MNFKLPDYARLTVLDELRRTGETQEIIHNRGFVGEMPRTRMLKAIGFLARHQEFLTEQHAETLKLPLTDQRRKAALDEINMKKATLERLQRNMSFTDTDPASRRLRHA